MALASNGATAQIIRNTDADGRFESALPVTTGSGVTGVTAGDFNGDGKPDQAIVNSTTLAICQEISGRDRAQRAYCIWERMLKGVRYPEGGPHVGCPDDGVNSEYAWKGMYGETCSPSRGAPKALADLGNSLISYCKASNDELQNALILLDKKCDELEGLLDPNNSKQQFQRAIVRSRGWRK
ncbi:FG-GAP repeat domain-containing protein [Singulisphaera acidiphila]|uniref:FG-GAP repeat domain-containing protein n=1 Tax=Singulisphaera acidiphila TaxID=466153 RepID=UPI0012B533EF